MDCWKLILGVFAYGMYYICDRIIYCITSLAVSQGVKEIQQSLLLCWFVPVIWLLEVKLKTCDFNEKF